MRAIKMTLAQRPDAFIGIRQAKTSQATVQKETPRILVATFDITRTRCQLLAT
jgi:hypothetical protein